MMTIDEIYIKEKISVRSYNICKYNELHTVQDIKEHYFNHKSFYNLRNCGMKSNEELIEICNIYKSTDSENEKFRTIISELTRVQRDVINGFISVNTNSLSVRSRNAISIYLKGNFKIGNFAEKTFLNGSFSLSKIGNIGLKSIPELEIYIKIIKDFIFKVVESKDKKQSISLKNNFLIKSTFSISEIPDEILESESIFLLTDFLLNKNAFFNEKQTAVVKKALKIYQNQKELTLDSIAIEVDLSTERVRQIRKICIEGLFKKLLFIQNFNEDLLQKYNIDINSNQIEINSDNVHIINTSNNINLSQEFITYILFAYLYDRFLLVGNIKDVLQSKHFNYNTRYNWSNLYLFSEHIFSEIDFNSFAYDIDRRLSARITKSYSFNFKNYLSKFLINNNTEILDSALPLAKKIVNGEFKLSLDLNENIVFKRNTSKQAHEYAYEALEQLGKSSKVTEIVEKVIELHPNYNTEEIKIRACMKREKGFVPIGRESIFGLKKWEGELDNFKGGTIRSIVKEYLSHFNTPKHLSEITNHVLKFRPKSNKYSISQNLKLEESGLYLFYKGSNIGLSTKKYDDSFIETSGIKKDDKRSWGESINNLNDFINKENRLPYSGGSDSEKKLYRWLNIQKNKYNDGKLSIEKRELIRRVYEKLTEVEKYSNYD